MDKKIDVKIGTKDEVFWTGLKKTAEEAITSCSREILIQKNLIEFYNKLIAEEEKK